MKLFAASLALFAGCAEVSGLSALDVSDATTDTSANDASDAADATDDAADAADAGDVADVAPTPCNKPSECPQLDYACCATLVTQGTFPQCSIADASGGTCTPKASCPTSGSPTTCGVDIVRKCSVAQDCVEPLFPKCCTFMYAGKPLQLCTNQAIADAGNAACL